MNTRLKDLRLDLGLTQKELAKKIGTTDKNVWAYEKGNVNPPIDIILAYAKLFNVSSDYLLGLEDDFGVRAVTSDLSSNEEELLTAYRSMNQPCKDLLIQTARTLSNSGANIEIKKARP